jgi:hypothetical protein
MPPQVSERDVSRVVGEHAGTPETRNGGNLKGFNRLMRGRVKVVARLGGIGVGDGLTCYQSVGWWKFKAAVR